MDDLLAAAKSAAEKAYAPYSRFRVGAAVRAGSGRVYAGCNVENASYGLAMCAERNAVFQAVAAGEASIETVVVYTPTASPTAPCGACRQVIAEFGLQARVLCVCDGPGRIDTTLGALLPEHFGPCNLDRGP
jgi:cytidine deaminase